MRSTLQHALTLHQSGQLDEARSIYLALLGEHPNHPDLHHLLGC